MTLLTSYDRHWGGSRRKAGKVRQERNHKEEITGAEELETTIDRMNDLRVPMNDRVTRWGESGVR